MKERLVFSFRIPTRLLRDLRTLGRTHKPHAHWLAKMLLLIATSRRKAGEPVSVPSDLFNMIVGILLTMPAPKPGRRPESSTPELQRLFAELGSKHGAAKAVSDKTGEDIEVLRRRLRPTQPTPRKPKRKRGT